MSQKTYTRDFTIISGIGQWDWKCMEYGKKSIGSQTSSSVYHILHSFVKTSYHRKVIDSQGREIVYLVNNKYMVSEFSRLI